MATVYLGLGSNLGKREDNIQRAIEALKGLGLDIKKCSSLVETEPMGGPPQGKFLNLVLKGNVDIPPENLLSHLQTIEKNLGRIKTVVNGPRTIDIDILLYDQLEMNTPQLTIPHPRMLDRNFVMEPLEEIAPDLIKELRHANH